MSKTLQIKPITFGNIFSIDGLLNTFATSRLYAEILIMFSYSCFLCVLERTNSEQWGYSPGVVSICSVFTVNQRF